MIGFYIELTTASMFEASTVFIPEGEIFWVEEMGDYTLVETKNCGSFKVKESQRYIDEQMARIEYLRDVLKETMEADNDQNTTNQTAE